MTRWDQKAVYDRLDRVRELPTLPSVVLEMNQLLQDIDTPLKSVTRTLEKDQAIVSKILQLVNSAFYGFRSKINSIENAVVLLGFNTVRNAVLSISVIEAFKGCESESGWNLEDFWRHSLTVAVLSKFMARETRAEEPDAFFVGGLIHDIGKLVMNLYLPELFQEIQEQMTRERSDFYSAEKAVAAVRHTQVGAYLTRRWQFPTELTEAVKLHHTDRSETQGLIHSEAVRAADHIAHCFCGGNGEVSEKLSEKKWPVDAEPLIASGPEWFPEQSEKIEEACSVFQLASGE